VRRDSVVMVTTNARLRKTKAHGLDAAVNGLDGELTSFVISLIDQNAELAVKVQSMHALLELAEKRVIERGKEAEGIKADAEKEANAGAADTILKAEGKAKVAAQEVVAKSKEKAEAEARQRANENLAAVRKKAEEETLPVRKEAEQLLASIRRSTQSAAEVSGKLCAQLDRDQGIRDSLRKAENKAAEPPEPEAAARRSLDVMAENPIGELPSSKEERYERDEFASYDDFVDLALPPPVALDQMLELYKRLNRDRRVKVIDLKGSRDKGVWIRFIVQAHTPLLSVFAALPEVEKVSYEVIEVGKITPADGKRRWAPSSLAGAGKQFTSSQRAGFGLNDGLTCMR
jgi:hypothetical protein